MKILYKTIKEKSNIKGYWKDSKGKVYIDNIQEVILTDSHKEKLFAKGEICIFYYDNENAYIENKEGNIDILSNKKEFYFENISKKQIKNLLTKYNGFTIYNNKNIVIWQ